MRRDQSIYECINRFLHIKFDNIYRRLHYWHSISIVPSDRYRPSPKLVMAKATAVEAVSVTMMASVVTAEIVQLADYLALECRSVAMDVEVSLMNSREMQNRSS